MITAHGGAHKTGRNSMKYFNSVEHFFVECIEVDVRRFRGELVLSHLPCWISGKHKVPLKYALELVRDKNLKINIDLKENGLVSDVLTLAKSVGAEDRLFFTGVTTLSDSKYIDAGEVWYNTFNFKFPMTAKNVPKIKKILDELNNPHVKGINVEKRFCTDKFIMACKEADIGLSIYTVDSKKLQRKFLAYNVENMTTNKPIKAAKVREEIKGD